MDTFIKVLRYLDYIFGFVVIVGGFVVFIITRALVPLLLAVGLLVVGPVENWLESYFHVPKMAETPPKAIINQVTSLVLEICMIAAILLSL